MEKETKSNGALVGSIIIIVLLIIGGIYVYQSKVKEMRVEEQKQTEAQKTSDEELNKLEQDLKASDATVNVDVNKVE